MANRSMANKLRRAMVQRAALGAAEGAKPLNQLKPSPDMRAAVAEYKGATTTFMPGPRPHPIGKQRRAVDHRTGGNYRHQLKALDLVTWSEGSRFKLIKRG